MVSLSRLRRRIFLPKCRGLRHPILLNRTRWEETMALS